MNAFKDYRNVHDVFEACMEARGDADAVVQLPVASRVLSVSGSDSGILIAVLHPVLSREPRLLDYHFAVIQPGREWRMPRNAQYLGRAVVKDQAFFVFKRSPS